MEVPGSLLQAMQEVSSSLAVLVVDESGYIEGSMKPFAKQRISFLPGKDVTWAQQRVIMLAKAYNCPIAFIQCDKKKPVGSYKYRYGKQGFSLDLNSYDAIHTPLRALLSRNTEVINKHSPNAFHDTSLPYWLGCQYQNRGVENLVVIGWHSRKCIPATIGPEAISWQGLNTEPGAVEYNYNVLTCQKVLNGPIARWGDSSDLIKFYSHL